ncbi:MAG: PhoH family protein [Dysgonamonadaceae bacterium]|nr:PhoH family protein [Dysgonamonadaceae bacterium]
MFDILYLNDLNIKAVEKTFPKTLKQLQAGDFKSADVRKMPNTGFYRARLDIRDRLLFNFVTHERGKYILLLEVIKDHNYAHSRFLRGAMIDESHFVAVENPEKEAENIAGDLIYLNKQNKAVHILNKFISFDDFQQSVYTIHPPMIIVGSAGSGKTALVLEKLKNLHGNVAYISLSKYLVDNASNLYYTAGYDSEQQEAEFLSLKDYLALWKKPEGKEVTFKHFERWFARHAQAVRINEPYRVFEEFKGVISGSPVHTAWLSQKEYMELGVKQSIFPLPERERLYPLFLKYVDWLKEENLYDTNILCYEYLENIQPYYDYIMVDEVQDITNIQLKCILASLKQKSNFILTGDSNQIVHPNFFSWSKIKTYFYEGGENQENAIKILQTNYRNSLRVVELSNHLLKIKNARFGSIDRESNYLINTVSRDSGEVLLYANDEKKKRELNRRTQNSAKYAVIVPDNAQKAKAAQFFKTPLIFNIHEAKGLEYENVILTDFISSHEAEFREIIAGVGLEDLQKEDLRYNRAGNKHDKDAEIYKFYINSLYVAITRAVKNIYIFEERAEHPLLKLLQMQENKAEIQVREVQSSREEWLDEARRLEEQGKYEQAEQIRAKYLGYEYISPEQLEKIKILALDPSKKEAEVKKERKQLFQYAVNHRNYDWVEQLARLQFQRAILYMKEVRNDRKEYEKQVRLGNKSKMLSIVQKYGVDFTTEEGVSGLMLALYHGQDELAKELLTRGASCSKTDNKNQLALNYLINGFFMYKKQKQIQLTTEQTLIRFWDKVCPKEIVYEYQKRQFHINSRSMLFFLILLMRANINRGIFDMNALEQLTAMMPDGIVPLYRKKRTYINSIMALNEREKISPYCKSAFFRVDRGLYILNPDIVYVTT